MSNAIFNTLCADYEDILPSTLEGEMSKLLGAPYLQELSEPECKRSIKGVVWGVHLRPIISLNVQISESIMTLTGTKQPVHVHFLYLATSPQTYMSDEALRAIGVEDIVVVGDAMSETPSTMRIPLLINGYRTLISRSPSDSHFAHLNILAEDFVRASGARVIFGGDNPQFEIVFP
ncbi:hypothetical protein BGZ50_004593 [Haplosporangium sp. Z 11]|nr:hypothetical protein BGZ50_004593 [Haplosporangium sp. Z 11]